MKQLVFRNSLLLIFFCIALYGILASAFPLLDPDEPVYGETAKEMIAFGDWLSPRIYGQFWYDKPPLFYWAEALSFSLFGISHETARWPSVFFGTLTALTVYLSGRRFLEERVAFGGAFISATSLEMILLAGASVTDMLLTFTLTVSLFSFLLKKYIPAYIFCGFALLAKGPVGFGFPALIVAIWMILSKTFTVKHLMSLKWFWGIPLACLIGFPWYIYMYLLHGQPFIDTFLGYHNLVRFSSPEHIGQNHTFFYIPVLLIGFYPWTGILPDIIFRIRTYGKDPNLLYLLVWTSFIFLFFSISATQLISYILPMFPPLSLLASYAFFHQIDHKTNPTLFLTCHLVFGCIVAVAIAFVPFPPIGGSLTLCGLWALIVIASCFSAYQYKFGRLRAFFITQIGYISILTVSVWTAFAPAVTTEFSSYRIGKQLRETDIKKDIPIYIDSFYRPSIAFYQNIYGYPFLSSDLKDHLESKKEKIKKGIPLTKEDEMFPSQAYILVQKKHFERWPAWAKEDFQILWEQDTAYLLLKQGENHE